MKRFLSMVDLGGLTRGREDFLGLGEQTQERKGPRQRHTRSDNRGEPVRTAGQPLWLKHAIPGGSNAVRGLDSILRALGSRGKAVPGVPLAAGGGIGRAETPQGEREAEAT